MARVFQIVIYDDGKENNNGSTFQTNVISSEPLSVRLLNIQYNHSEANHSMLMYIESDQLLSMYGERYVHFLPDVKGGTNNSLSDSPTFRLLSDGRMRLRILNKDGTEPAHEFACILTFCVE